MYYNNYDKNKSIPRRLQILSLSPRTLTATLSINATINKTYGIWGRVKNASRITITRSQVKFSWLRSMEDDEFLVFNSAEEAEIAAQRYTTMIKNLFKDSAIFEYRILEKK